MTPTPFVYEFEGFRLDPHRRVLEAPVTKGHVDLSPRVFDLLLLFVEQPGRLIDKAALLDHLWPDTAVEENSLERNISLLRRTLRIHGAPTDFIATERGRGYRFVARVARDGSTLAPATSVSAVAVLPFTAGPDDEALCALAGALSEEVRHTLHRAGCRVASSHTAAASYHQHHGDVRALGRALGVDAVLEGSVRTIAGRLRVTAQLVSTATGFHVWSQTLVRSPHLVSGLPGELAALVRTATAGTSVEEPKRHPATPDRAYYLFLQARALLLRPSFENIARAEVPLAQALTLAPEFGGALAERAMLSMLRYVTALSAPDLLDSAERDAQQALALDAHLPRAHQALAQAAIARGRWVEAREHADAAFALTGNTEVKAVLLLMILLPLGHVRTAYEQVLTLRSGAAQSAPAAVALTSAHVMVGDDAAARGYAELAMAMGITAVEPALHAVLGMIAMRAGEPLAGVAHLQAACSPALRTGGADTVLEMLGDGLRSPARRGEALEALLTLAAAVDPRTLQHHEYILLPQWLMLFDANDAVFDYFDRTLPQRRTGGTLGAAWMVLWAPWSEGLRRHPRFQQLIEQLGFMPYWARYGPPDGFAVNDGRLKRLA